MRCAIRERKRDSINNSRVCVRARKRASERIDKPTYTPEIHNIRAAAYTQWWQEEQERKYQLAVLFVGAAAAVATATSNWRTE
jgi:hypothetical protein